jgi:hypothetical protein
MSHIKLDGFTIELTGWDVTLVIFAVLIVPAIAYLYRVWHSPDEPGPPPSLKDALH